MLHRVVVAEGLDAADDWIVEHIGAHDVAVTADIPLAARCLEKGARVVGHTGKPFTEESIGMALAMRADASDVNLAGAYDRLHATRPTAINLPTPRTIEWTTKILELVGLTG